MKKTYLKPTLQVVEICHESTLLTFSDPHNPRNEEGAWFGGDLPPGVDPD